MSINTEAEWLSSADPASMLACVQGKASPRKLRLFAVACCYQVWDLLADERSRRAVETASRYADGEATEAERSAAVILAIDLFHEGAPAPWIRGLIVNAVEDLFPHGQLTQRAIRSGVPPATQAALLRCLCGNPWRPVPRPVRCADGPTCPQHGHPWLTPLVRDLARIIYDERRWGDLGILADALEEAGCPAEVECQKCNGKKRFWVSDRGGSDWCDCLDCHGTGRLPNPLLAHLRSEGPHARGCWAVDLILGKS